MTGPRPTLDEIMARPSLDDIMAAPPDQLTKWHQAYQSGRLKTAVQAANATDPERYALDTAPSYPERFGKMLERADATLGGGQLLTGLRAARTGESWDEAGTKVAQDVQEAGANAPGVTIPSMIPLIGGSRITLADAPAAALGFRTLLQNGLGPITAGGGSAGVPRAMSPAPESLGSRAKGTILATLLGAAVPAVTEGVSKGLPMAKAWRASAKALPYDENMVARGGVENVSGGARGEASAPLYAQFRKGAVLPETPALTAEFEKPAVQLALTQSQTGDLYGLPRTDPRVLDAISQRIGSKAWGSQHGMGELSGTVADFRSAVDAAAEEAGQPTLSAAIKTYAEHSRNMEAVTRGKNAMQYAARAKGAPTSAARKMSPAAFKEWQGDEARTPDQLAAANEGVLAQLKVEPKTVKLGGAIPVLKNIPIRPSQALREAPGLLNPTGGASPLARAMQAFTSDESPSVSSWVKSKFAKPTNAPPEPAPAGDTPLRATARVLEAGQYEMGTGAPHELNAPPERLRLPAGPSWAPHEGGGPLGPAIPTRPVPPTDAEMFGKRIPPNRQLPAGEKPPLITPKPLPSTASSRFGRTAKGPAELSKTMLDAELRRRLGLPPL